MKHLLRNILVVVMLVSTATFAQSAQSAANPPVASALTEWKEAVEAGKLEPIMKLYAKDAIMISTFAQNPLVKRSHIEDFFKKIIVNPDIKVEILESHPREFDGMATNSGRYELSYTQEGENISIPARFTFVYQLKGGKWIIVEQHSSRMPEGKEKVE